MSTLEKLLPNPKKVKSKQESVQAVKEMPRTKAKANRGKSQRKLFFIENVVVFITEM